MKISYDPEADALSITFRDATTTTKHLAEGIAADYDAAGRLTGLEVLDAVRRFGDDQTLRELVLEGVNPIAVVREKPDKKYGTGNQPG